MTRFNRGMVALLLILGIPKRVSAQDNPPPTRSTFWAFVALGTAQTCLCAVGVGAARQRRSLVLMGRIAAFGTGYDAHTEDLGLLAGIGTQRGRFHYLGAAGLGVVSEQGRTALSLPIEAHATWRFSGVAGIGLRGYLGLNTLSTFGGLTVMAEVGRLR